MVAGSNLAEVIERVLVREGGVADVGDGKGITRWGQTPAWLEQHGFPVPQTRDQARKNYDAYARRLGLADVAERSLPIGDLVMDVSVLSGDTMGPALLQAALRAGLMQDGVVGPRTLAALDRALARGGAEARLARDIFARRLEQVGRLLSLKVARKNPQRDNRKFAESWLSRLAGQARLLP